MDYNGLNGRKDELTSLGFLGVVPFFFAAICVWLAPLFGFTGFGLRMHSMALAYGGVIAGYMAGMGAGAALIGRDDRGLLAGMIATLIAWIAVWDNLPFFIAIPAAWRHAMVLGVLIYLLMRDLRAVDQGHLPGWYGPLRMRLTFWAGLSILAIIIRLITLGYS